MSGAGVETEKWVSENHFTFARKRLTAKIREGVGGSSPHLAPKEGRRIPCRFELFIEDTFFYFWIQKKILFHR